MITTKTKTLYPVTLGEVKRHLRVDPNNFEDDEYIENSIIPSATRFCENYIDRDIALTSNVLTIWDFIGNELRVNEGNLVSLDNIISDSSTLLTYDTLVKCDTHFIIEFSTSLDQDPLKVEFTTGYEEGDCPEEIKQAVYIQAGNLYDVERSSYTMANYSKRNDAVERLLNPWKVIRW